jgi:hypothetical protein
MERRIQYRLISLKEDIDSSSDVRFILRKEGGAVTYGHSDTFGVLKVCPKDSEYKCAIFAGVLFAVPRRISSASSWAFDGFEFTLAHRSEGSDPGLMVINAVNLSNPKFGRVRGQFVYSPTLGLLHWTSAIEGHASETFVLDGSQGLFSSVDGY